MKKKFIGLSVIISSLLLSLAFLGGCASEDVHTIDILIPPAKEPVYVSNDKVLIAQEDEITVKSAAGSLDGTIMILNNAKDAKNVYEPTYITAGVPVTFEAEKGAEYRVNFGCANEGDETVTITLTFEGAKVK